MPPTVLHLLSLAWGQMHVKMKDKIHSMLCDSWGSLCSTALPNSHQSNTYLQHLFPALLHLFPCLQEVNVLPGNGQLVIILLPVLFIIISSLSIFYPMKNMIQMLFTRSSWEFHFRFVPYTHYGSDLQRIPLHMGATVWMSICIHYSAWTSTRGCFGGVGGIRVPVVHILGYRLLFFE